MADSARCLQQILATLHLNYKSRPGIKNFKCLFQCDLCTQEGRSVARILHCDDASWRHQRPKMHECREYGLIHINVDVCERDWNPKALDAFRVAYVSLEYVNRLGSWRPLPKPTTDCTGSIRAVVRLLPESVS